MDRKPVKSSNVKSVGYDPATQTLEIEFHSGAVHQYAGVPQEGHAALLKAKSIASHFHHRIRGSYPSKQIA